MGCWCILLVVLITCCKCCDSSVASGVYCKGGCDDEWGMSGKVVDILAFAYD